MNKEAYIKELRQRLLGLDYQEVEDALSYCEEYFDEAGEGNVQQVIHDLGTPAKFAAQIRADSAIRNERNRKQNAIHVRKKGQSLKNIGVIVLGIFALPIALPLAFAAIMLLFAAILVIVALCFAMFITFLSLFFIGIPLIINGIVHLSNIGNALIAIGSGFVCIGVGSLLVIGLYRLLKILIPALSNAMANLYSKAREKRRHETN